MTDFFGSVRNIELMDVNDSTLLEMSAPDLDELSGQSTILSTSPPIVSLTPPPLAAVR